MPKKSQWSTLEEWKDEGIKREYDQRNPLSISEGKNQEEKIWDMKRIEKR